MFSWPAHAYKGRAWRRSGVHVHKHTQEVCTSTLCISHLLPPTSFQVLDISTTSQTMPVSLLHKYPFW